MDKGRGLHNRGHYIALKIRSLLTFLTVYELQEYDKIAQKIEFWIEYVLRERFTTVDELVEGVSYIAWDGCKSHASIAWFFRGFRMASHRSEQAKTFVDELCGYILRWFAIVSVENLSRDRYFELVGKYTGNSFVAAASLVGHLIEQNLLSHELVRRHLIKPLIAHHHTDQDSIQVLRASAIYQLFTVAGNTLLRGLLEPEDVQVCFETLDSWVSRGEIAELSERKLQELREIHTTWLEQKEKEEQSDVVETEECKGQEEDTLAAEVPAEIETPIAFVPRDLPTPGADIDLPSSILHGMESSSETFVNIPDTALSSPTLSISTVSDLTSTEFGEEAEHSKEPETATRHDTFYFADGNVEIACGGTIFRVHSTILSFSSSKLRDLLSPSTLLDAPMPEGCPRIVFPDSADDFAVLLKMIYTPGFPARSKVPEFSLFASLLRMVTKYGFSDIREHLFEDLGGAYPTKWEDFEAAKVLGEDIFGSPKPHPNTVLNLFMEQNVRFAIPFAAYRASMGGFSALMSDEPGTVLPRHTLASSIWGMERSRSFMIQAGCNVAYEQSLPVCADKACVLNAGIVPGESRAEALQKLHNVMIEEKEGGILSPPSWGDIACVECTKKIDGHHVVWRKACWEMLPALFGVAKRWYEEC